MSGFTTLKLGYWNIRGLAQPIRFVLEHLAIPYEEVLFRQAGASAAIPFDKSCWFDVKDTLGLPFPNLPYLFHEDVKISQSQAILRYVCKLDPNCNLLGANATEAAEIDQIIAEMYDCKGKMTGLQYGHGIEGAALSFLNGSGYGDLQPMLQRFSAVLGSRPWFVGTSLSAADFVMYEFISCACMYFDASVRSESSGEGAAAEQDLVLRAVPNLKSFKDNFEALPNIRSYLASDKFKDVSAWNNQHAKFR